ncbi:hypothetical protein Bbelb_030050 [Branchiostoma belcheri]|nr:hypothetical protein Bbelb_030050 [Branchiostoma belcheri]
MFNGGAIAAEPGNALTYSRPSGAVSSYSDPDVTLQQEPGTTREHGQLYTLDISHHPVSSDHFSNTLRKCLERAHLDPQAYTAHSFRIGAATHAASSGASDAQLRALGRWSSDAFKSYIRP